MAFPEDPLAVQIEAQAGGEWLDITGNTYTRDPLSFSGGRGDEASSADPGKCSLTLNNKDGRYSPKNPESELYGRIGRNTPLRVSVRGVGESHMDVDGTLPNYASTPDASVLDITGDLDVRAEISTQWWGLGDVSRSVMSKWDPAGNQRSWDLRMYLDQLRFTWSSDGTSAGSVTVNATMPRLPRRAAIRATVDVNNGAGAAVATVYWAESLDGPWYLIFAYTHSTTSSVYASTAPLRIAGNDPTTTPPRMPFAGEVHRCEVRNGIGGTIVASPDFRALDPGATAFTDSAGRAWTLSGTAEITDRQTRFYGEVSSWPQKWAPSGKDVWVPLEAAGLLRRLGQGAKPLESTMRRRIPSFGPAAYWPMEDGQNATQMYSPLVGVTPLQLYGTWQMSGDDTLSGSASLPQLGDNAEMRGAVPRASGDGWQVDLVYHMATAPTSDQTLLRVATSGTWRHVRVAISSIAIRVYGYDDDGTQLLLLESVPTGVFSSKWTRFQMWATQDGGDVDLHVAWVQLGVGGYQLNGTYTARAGRVSGVYTKFGTFESAAVGHLAVFHGSEIDTFTGADLGFQNETTRNRMRRLALEEGVPLALAGDQTTAPQMGPQGEQTLLDLFAECAAVDGGILGEERDSLSLLYRSRESLYGQDPVMVLDYSSGEIAPPLEPVDDDQRTRNDITVQRDGGSSARVVQEDGPLSVAAPPDGVGVYNESVTLNLAEDEQTEEVAGWLLHLGTWDGTRYPSVTLRLHKRPELIPAFLKLKAGDKIRLTNLPSWLPPGDADLLVEGWDETVLPRKWEATLACSPAGPWDIGIVDDDEFGRVDTDGSHVAVGAVLEDFADGTYAFPTTDFGAAAWFRTNTTPAHSGAYSLRAGAIADGQNSQFAVTVPAGMQSLTFWYRTSSEPSGVGYDGDYFALFLDSVETFRAQGVLGWTQATVDVSGVTQVTFVYAKDGGTATGQDTAWIDDVVFFTGDPLGEAATTLQVVTPDGPVWTTDLVTEGEFDIRVGGEVMTVTAVTGTTSPQTFTVVRSVNGISKSHAEGTDVRLAHPAIVGR